ncbi:MAG: glycosyltransferase family 39 protein [Chloroflexi bacterium]|nr:glycosyltransferase family 39 protein [Chloroflexota bacterium]
MLALILLLALMLRLVNLGTRSLWYDEAFAVLFSEKGLDAMLAGTLTPVAGGAADIHPLLYYSTLNLWMAVFGQSPAAVRLWSVLLGVATVGVMYLLGRDLFGARTGLVAALITAVAPFHVQYSQETRMYALLGLLLLLATWCFVRGNPSPQPPPRIRRGGVGWWLAFGVLAALAMYTQQLAAFYLIALGLVPVLARRRDLLVRVALGTAVAVILYLPWLVNLPSQFGKVQSYYWLSPPNIGQLLLTIRSFLVVHLEIPAPASTLGFLGSIFLIAFLMIQVVIVLRGRRSRGERTPLLLVLWLAAAPVALLWLVSQLQPVYLIRALLPSALMLYLALAWLFNRAGLPRPIAAVIGGGALALAVVGLYHQYTWSTFPNSPYPAAVAAIRAEWQAGDVVIHQDKLSALPMIYYERDLPQRYLRDLPGSGDDTLALPTQQALGLLADESVEQAAAGARRVWWVVFDFAERQYAAAGRPELREAVAWLDEQYAETGRWTFNDLILVRYEER